MYVGLLESLQMHVCAVLWCSASSTSYSRVQINFWV